MAFTKATLTTMYREFLAIADLTPDQAIVSAGGACVMYGFREQTLDIDIDVTETVFQQFLAQGFTACNYDTPLGRVRVIDLGNAIDIHEVSTFPPHQLIDDVAVYSPAALLQQKLRLNRDKDQADIEHLRALTLTQ